MNGTQQDWERYRRWNAAIADVVYSPAQAGLPVYLDLEDDVLDAIRDKADPDAHNSTEGLVAAVKGTLRLTSGPADLLSRHQLELSRWSRTDKLAPPPTLGLLALLSLAAENMQEGDGHASHNFYGRLGQLMGLTDKQTGWFIDAYRAAGLGPPVSEQLWGSLADWLEAVEGNRGLPTAYAETHAHVGLALSQALVRHTDRQRLEDLFVLNGLAPHGSLPAPEMEQLIDEWVSRDHCPASNHLIRLWKGQSGAKERIVDVALAELEAWDGSASMTNAESAARKVDSVRVTALLRHFPRRQVVIGLATPIRSDQSIEELEVLSEAGEPVGHLDLVPSASGWWTMADAEALDIPSFLAGQTALKRRSTEFALTRRPRRLIALRQDDLLQAFVESERVSLGEESLLIARSEIADKVDELLRLTARPGFQRHDELPGLPDEWTLFESVQILSSIPRDLLTNRLYDLHALQPLASSQVLLEGGLKIPGNIPKWSPNGLPEVRITAEEATRIEATLSCRLALTLPEPETRRRSSEQSVLVWDLSEEFLSDGDYELLVEADGQQVGRPTVLRVRSADHPAVEVEEFRTPLLHRSGSPFFGVGATREDVGAGFAVAPDEVEPLMGQPLGAVVPSWFGARQQRTPARQPLNTVVMPGANSNSCMATGFHHMMIETAYAGMKSVEGICRHCGLAKRYPTRAKRKKTNRSKGAKRAVPLLDVAELPAVRDRARVDWATGFDVLSHLGSGRSTTLGRVASQMEAGSVFNDVFGRHLAILGHIEVDRDPTTLATMSWRMNNPTLIEVGSGVWHLVGFRSEQLLVALEDAAYDHGLDVSVDDADSAPPTVRVETSDREVVEAIAQAIAVTGRGQTRIVQSASHTLASSLRPLSELRSALPRVILQGARSVEKWDPVTARFNRSETTTATGAYRLNGFSRTYVLRTPDNLVDQTALVGDARIVKYLAALDAGMSLVGYDPESGVLYVPLGADLPGLYGRAAVFASGRPPHQNRSEGLLEYRRVSPELAGHIAHLLMS